MDTRLTNPADDELIVDDDGSFVRRHIVLSAGVAVVLLLVVGVVVWEVSAGSGSPSGSATASASAAPPVTAGSSPAPASASTSPVPVVVVPPAGPPAGGAPVVVPVAVPDVVGRDVTAATAAMNAAGFAVTVSDDPSSTEPAGTVVGQDPAAGSRAAPGTAVALSVAPTPRTVTLFDLSGMTASQAHAVLLGLGLVEVVDGDPSAPQVVTKQVPDAGTAVPVGSTVTVQFGPAA